MTTNISQAIALCKKKKYMDAWLLIENMNDETEKELSKKEFSDLNYVRAEIYLNGISEAPKDMEKAKGFLERSILSGNVEALIAYFSYFYEDPLDISFLQEQFEHLDDGRQSAKFYAEYGRILELSNRDEEMSSKKTYDICQRVIQLCQKSIDLNPKPAAPYTYLGRLYKNYSEALKEDGFDPFEKSEEYYKIALQKGSSVALSELGSLSKKRAPELSFDLMNVDENLAAFIENLTTPYINTTFSLLLYGPKGSGKIPFAEKLMKALKTGYKEISIEDFINNGTIRVFENVPEEGMVPIERSLKSTIRKYMREDKKGILFKDIDMLFSLSTNKANKFEENRNISALIEILSDHTLPIIMIADDITMLPQHLLNAFMFRICFRYMDGPQKEAAYRLFFNFEAPTYLKRLGGLVIDDFSRLKKKAKILRILDDNDKILSLLEEEARFKAGGNSSYLKPDTSFDTTLINADTNLTALTEKLRDKPDSPFTMIIYGPPGTGKSYYLRYLADQMGLNTIEKTAAELFSKYQGEPAKNVARMFREAEEKKAMIILDEIEEILKNREDSTNSWKNDMVNTFLAELESSKYPFVCTTNFLELLDKASLRRFVFKIKFDYLTKEQCRLAFKHFFKLDPPADLSKIGGLTNGDFATVKKKAILLDHMGHSDELFAMLKEESEKKAKVRVAQLFDVKRFDGNFINTDLEMLELFVKNIKKENRAHFSMLLYGPSGTGKSLFLRHVASELGYEVIERRSSDIISKWYGETQRNLAKAFEEAKDREAFLIFDEIDSFLINSSEASISPFHNQLVNEFLIQMENHPYPFAGTTNRINKIEYASRRRFTIQSEFTWLKPEQYDYVYEQVFGFKPFKDISKLKHLVPAIFVSAYDKADLMDMTNDPEKVYEIFIKEAEESDAANIQREEDRTYEKLSIPFKALYHKPIDEMYGEVLKGFVKIITDDGHGSGFFITKDGFILTNKHVVMGNKTVSIELFSGRRIPGEVLRTNDLDVALVKVSGENLSTPMPLRLEELNIGSSVYSMGNPSRHNQVLTKGIITRYSENSKGYKRIEGDNFAHSGVSGGPLMDEHGNVIGINVEGRKDPSTEYKTRIGLSLQVPIIEALEVLNISIKKEKE